MKYFFAITIIFSTIYTIFCGKISELSTAVLQSANDAITLALSITGVMCLWNGVMTIAKRSGVTDFCAKLLSPLLSLIFKGINKSGNAMKAISMNVIANLFGLGNASTPIGIEAMKCLENEEKPKDSATRNMMLLVVINTASIQLVPTTVSAIRLANGSASPFEIIPAVLISSAVSVTVAIISVYIFWRIKRR